MVTHFFKGFNTIPADPMTLPVSLFVMDNQD